jgi:hypothetical protein
MKRRIVRFCAVGLSLFLAYCFAVLLSDTWNIGVLGPGPTRIHTSQPLMKFIFASGAVLSLLFPLFCLIGELKRLRRPVPGTCRCCGYDLRATPGCCPECGMVPHAKE